MAEQDQNTNFSSNVDEPVIAEPLPNDNVNNNPYKMHSSNKILIALLIIFIAALVALYFYNDANNNDEVAENTEVEQVEQPTPTPTAMATPTPTPEDELQTDEVIMELESTNGNPDMEAQLESLNFDEIGSELNSDSY